MTNLPVRFLPARVLMRFLEAITAAFRPATMQTYVVYLVRHSLAFCSQKED